MQEDTKHTQRSTLYIFTPSTVVTASRIVILGRYSAQLTRVSSAVMDWMLPALPDNISSLVSLRQLQIDGAHRLVTLPLSNDRLVHVRVNRCSRLRRLQLTAA